MKRVSETARVNKVTILCHGIITTIIALAYLLEVFKGSRTVLYFLLIAVLALAPVAMEIMMYRKNAESRHIRKVIGYGYALLYAVAIFTTHSLLPFTYIIPMIIVITLYSDVAFCVKVGVGGVLLNIADVVYKAFTRGYAQEEIPDLEIRLLVILIIALYVVLATRVSKQINVDKRQELQEEKDKAEKLLETVIRLSGELSDGVEKVDGHMASLDKSVEEMSTAMEEVTAGTQETAESVQNQLIRTEEIQKLIGDVREVGVYIKESMDKASDEVESGTVSMSELARQSKQSKEANATVVKQMEEVHKQAEKMNEIIGLITNIANRTSMLALNASIEAARAGEAGSGFAVVARQVSELSDQTKAAAGNITELIGSVTGELNQVADAVKVLEENTDAQDSKIEELGGSLTGIKNMTGDIAARTSGLEQMIEKLAAANGDIVQNIQTISAITEEVTAHSSETLSTCRENQRTVEEVSRITAVLNQNAGELKNAQVH